MPQGPGRRRTRARATALGWGEHAVAVVAAPGGAETLYGFAGQCQSLMLADRDTSARCQDIAFSARFPGGRLGYIFLADDGAHVAFEWPSADLGEAAAALSAEKSVDRIGFVFAGEAELMDASGFCDFVHADDGATRISCEATTPKGVYRVAFRTDGHAPKKLFGAPEGSGEGR